MNASTSKSKSHFRAADAPRPLFAPEIVRRAIVDAFRKLDPRLLVRNPVMFVVLVGSVYTTAALVHDIATGKSGIGFLVQLALWLWFTVLFANFAEAMAEGRGKAQADTLRKSRTQTSARRLPAERVLDGHGANAPVVHVPAETLRSR